MKLAPHIALSKNPVHRVVLPQEERGAVGSQFLPLLGEAQPGEHDLAGLLRNQTMICIQTDRLRLADIQRDRR